jgi:predicted lipoprotein
LVREPVLCALGVRPALTGAAQGSALTIKMTFTAGKPVSKAVWDLKYMVDMASKRKLIGPKVRSVCLRFATRIVQLAGFFRRAMSAVFGKLLLTAMHRHSSRPVSRDLLRGRQRIQHGSFYARH